MLNLKLNLKFRRNSHILVLYLVFLAMGLCGIQFAGLFAAQDLDIWWLLLVGYGASVVWSFMAWPITKAVCAYYGFDD